MGKGWERKRDPSARAVRKGRDPEVVRFQMEEKEMPLRDTASKNGRDGERQKKKVVSAPPPTSWHKTLHRFSTAWRADH